MHDLRKLLRKVISESLNADQVDHIAQKVDGKFRLAKESGFGNIAIPASAAAETVLRYFNTEEDWIRFYEQMLDREGVLIHGSRVQVLYKKLFVETAAKIKWIYDPDIKRFFRDRFYLEKLNFLRQIEVIDLREEAKKEEIPGIIEKLETYREDIAKEENLGYQITVRVYNIDRQVQKLLQATLELMLEKDRLNNFTTEIYTCLKEIAINASKAAYKEVYKMLFESEFGMKPEDNMSFFQEKFRQELERNGDARVSRLAHERDMFFDVMFKSNQERISVWATNYTPISRFEKIQLMSKLQIDQFADPEFDHTQDEMREGAGLGINLVLRILKKISPYTDPLTPVFYANKTKVGFTLDRQFIKTVVK